MESSVASHISSKIYNAEVSKLAKEDIDAQSELYEIQIFNNTLHIAPGIPIVEDELVYMFVYAIKNEKVIANLGIFELLTDEPAKAYDLSTFETPLLLFDYYYTNPSKLKEFAIAENNIFDFISKYLIQKYDVRITTIYKELNKYRQDFKSDKEFVPYAKLYKSILEIIYEEMKTTGIDMKKIQKMKELATTETNFKLILAILEPFLNVRFMITDKGKEVSNLREKAPFDFTPTQMIVVSLDQVFVSSKKIDETEKVEAEEQVEVEAEEEEIEAAEQEREEEPAEKAKISKEVTVKTSKPVKPYSKIRLMQEKSVEEKTQEMVDYIEKTEFPPQPKWSEIKSKAREDGLLLESEQDKDLFKGLLRKHLESRKSASKAEPKDTKESKESKGPKAKIQGPSGLNVKPKLSKISEAESEEQSAVKESKPSKGTSDKAESKAESKAEGKEVKEGKETKPRPRPRTKIPKSEEAP